MVYPANHQRNNTHCLNHEFYLDFRHNVTFTLTSKDARESIQKLL